MNKKEKYLEKYFEEIKSDMNKIKNNYSSLLNRVNLLTKKYVVNYELTEECFKGELVVSALNKIDAKNIARDEINKIHKDEPYSSTNKKYFHYDGGCVYISGVKKFYITNIKLKK